MNAEPIPLSALPRPTVPPLIERLLEHPAAQPVSEGGLDDFLAQPGEAVLFLWAQPARYPEVLDVAVVLPELVAQFAREGTALRIGVVDEASERALGLRYGMTRRPALIFLRDGAYVATLHGMQDWQVYVERIREILASAPSRPPSPGIAVAGPSGACH